MKSKVIEITCVLNDHYLKGKEDQLICMICKGIIRTPIQCSTCKKNFCSECIRSLINCPNSTHQSHIHLKTLKLEMSFKAITSFLNNLVFDKGSSYIQKLKEISPYEEIDNRVNKLISYINGIYEGDLFNNKRDGYGIHKWNIGDIYEGYWKNDQQNGIGKMLFSDGNTYNGEWLNGHMEGYGIFTWADGDKYDGQFSSDQRNGHGKMLFSNGNLFIGEWFNGSMKGHGIYKWNNGDQYDGFFSNDMQNGQGIFKYSNGITNQGEWLNGELISFLNH